MDEYPIVELVDKTSLPRDLLPLENWLLTLVSSGCTITLKPTGSDERPIRVEVLGPYSKVSVSSEKFYDSMARLYQHYLQVTGLYTLIEEDRVRRTVKENS